MRRVVTGLVALVAGFVCVAASPAAAGGLGPIDHERKVPVGRYATVYLNEDISGDRYTITTSRVRAVGQGRTVSGRDHVRLPAGRWRVTRTVSYEASSPSDLKSVVYTPAVGQCTVTGGKVEGSLVEDIYADCMVQGGTSHYTMSSVYLQPDAVHAAFLNRVPVGQDLVTALADPANFQSLSPVKVIVPRQFADWIDVPRTDLGPFTVTRRDRVRVRQYNPGCVTWGERARLRIGLARGEWHRIVGGSGTVDAESSGGVEVRSYLGCWWTSLDEVTVRFVAGRVDAYQVVH